MTIRQLASACLALSLCAGAAPVLAEDIPIDQLPQAVVQAIQQRFPGATIKDAERETENGQPVFEVEIDVNGDDKDVKIRPTGEILKVDD
jgi:hypothetical protein